MSALYTKPLHFIEHQLDRVGMYRTVTLGLLFIALCSLWLGLVGELPYSPIEQLLSLGFITGLALAVNVGLAYLLKISANHESAVITALILFFLFLPPQGLAEWFFVGVATVVAIVSKFVLVWRKQHVVNAAAIGAVAVSLPYFLEAPWWVATPVLFVPLLIAGLAVVMKVRKWELVGSFILVALAVFVFEEVQIGRTAGEAIGTFFLSWPALFLAFFMLTEPFTMPGTKHKQVTYGTLVGFLSSTAIFTPYFAMTPELALVLGNLAVYPFSLRQKLFLPFVSRRELAANTWEYVFLKPSSMQFKAGQYLEWMLPHEKSDNRGPRRYFTIASAPEEDQLRLALRIEPEGGSTYKQALAELQPGDELIASQRAGDFMLPVDTTTKLAFVAGGIGVTPFSSHLAHMHLTGEWRDSVLYYCNNYATDIAYGPEFYSYTQGNPFKLVHVLAKEEHPEHEHGYLTKEIIERQTPDYLERTWYLSGPPGMVNAYYKLLRELKVSKRQIKRDFFPGLA
jgi:ferredoxin-NADP reductase